MNAYRIEATDGFWEHDGDIWYGDKNPFSRNGYRRLANGDLLLLAEPSEGNDAKLETCDWCFSHSVCQVDSPQTGDDEPICEHETLDGGEQLLWVS